MAKSKTVFRSIRTIISLAEEERRLVRKGESSDLSGHRRSQSQNTTRQAEPGDQQQRRELLRYSSSNNIVQHLLHKTQQLSEHHKGRRSGGGSCWRRRRREEGPFGEGIRRGCLLRGVGTPRYSLSKNKIRSFADLNYFVYLSLSLSQALQ